jgi:hypothetical protein
MGFCAAREMRVSDGVKPMNPPGLETHELRNSTDLRAVRRHP